MASSKLSELQIELVNAFFSEPSAFFLTGGAALAGYYIGHRFTDDLDLFSPPVESMELAVQRLRRAAYAIGATVEAVQEAPDAVVHDRVSCTPLVAERVLAERRSCRSVQ